MLLQELCSQILVVVVTTTGPIITENWYNNKVKYQFVLRVKRIQLIIYNIIIKINYQKMKYN